MCIQQDRHNFDTEMTKEFASRRILGRFDLEKAMKMANFTWRRFAYWLNKVGKQIYRECEDLVKNNGILGKGKAKISRSAHFA